MLVQNKIKIPLKQLIANQVNNTNIRTDHMNDEQRSRMEKIIDKYKNLCSEPDAKLTFTTKVVGTIRTITENPVYSKFYSYPIALRKEVEEQVEKLLEDDIIRPSRSPYNSPVWVVPKKIDASGERKHRLVIDYRKLNSVTISDKYLIPNINDTLAQLGGNKWFSVIDLKSGFHQIPLRTTDIEKTAFSINNGKYEFIRLPFGLKNAPAIFQRTLDDILRSFIGKTCFVYIDDIIIFSRDETQHFKDLEDIFETLENANMKIQLNKCEFLKKETEFLGFIVSEEGIKTNPGKIKAIAEFPYPATVYDLRSFLGLAGYYRRFVIDYAKVAKPLTNILRGVDGRISKNQSKKTPVHLDDVAKEAFNKIKRILTSREIILNYPDPSKDFELTTDASNYAIGAVLSQGNRPIAFISRALSVTEENYATNEREMLAIIWSLKILRNYLYGSAEVIIYTDHQPLTYALSNKNTNSKMKRWKSILVEYDYELHYKPGKSNVVADALSRPPRGDQINTLTATAHSDESSSENLIPIVEAPINAFKNQIFIQIGNEKSYNFELPFARYHRHTIIQKEYSEDELIKLLKKYLNPDVSNGIFTEESIMGKIQNIYPLHFEKYRVKYTRRKVTDLTDETRQEEEILRAHKRAHRNSKENKEQILENYYFPKMMEKINKVVGQCKTCKENKYDRKPNKIPISATPIPKHAGEILHIDIYITGKNLVLTALDKLTKYAQTYPINSNSTEDIKEPLRKMLFAFGIPKILVMDNEKALNSASICFMIEGVTIHKTPPYTSTSNGQVERFHSTLTEIMRCLKTENLHKSFIELLDRAVYEYNCTIHSTTQKKPIEAFFGRNVSTDPNLYEKARQENIEAIAKKQEKDLETHNRKRKPQKNYSIGDTIYVKINKRLGTKLSARYKKQLVKEDNRNTIITESGKVVLKNLIRN